MQAIADTVNRRLNETERRYNSLDSIPFGYRDFISDLVDAGIVRGKNDGTLYLSLDMNDLLLSIQKDYHLIPSSHSSSDLI